MTSLRVGLCRKRKATVLCELNGIELTDSQEIDRELCMNNSVADNIHEKSPISSRKDTEHDIDHEQVQKKPKRLSFRLKQLQGVDLKKQKQFETQCQNLDVKDLIEEVAYFQSRIKSKQSTISELKNVEIYAKKHNVSQIDELFEKWKESCQLALEDLLQIAKEKSNKESMRMIDLLNDLNIPKELVDFDVENDLFLVKN